MSLGGKYQKRKRTGNGGIRSKKEEKGMVNENGKKE
jgi:hypothetical protein